MRKQYYTDTPEIRCVSLAKYLIENKTTVRNTASKFGISKSTVHKDITETLKKVDVDIYDQAKAILEINKQERHLRGGEATRIKYSTKKKKY